MKRSDSSFAPEPIASMPITEPTPNTMPRAVSSVRVFCARRFARAWPISAKRMIIVDSAFMALRPSALGGRLVLLVGIGHRHQLAFLDAGDHRLALAAAHQGDVVRHEALGRLQVDEGTAVAFKQRLRGNPDDVVQGFDRDHHVGGHARDAARAPAGPARCGTRTCGPRAARGAADGLHVAGERLARQRHHADRHLLALGKVAAVQLADLGADFPVLEVGNLRHRHAGPGRVAELEGRKFHALIDHDLVAVIGWMLT